MACHLEGSWPFPSEHSSADVLLTLKEVWPSRAQSPLISTCPPDPRSWVQWVFWARNPLLAFKHKCLEMDLKKKKLNDKTKYLSLFCFSSCGVPFDTRIPDQSLANKWATSLHSFGKQGFPSDVFYNFGSCGKNFSFQRWFHDNILQKLTLYNLTSSPLLFY